MRAEALCAGEELVEERVVDHPEHGAFLVDEPDGNGDVWEAVYEVRRTICMDRESMARSGRS